MLHFAITKTPMPNTLLCGDPDVAIRELSESERFELEDHYFGLNQKLAIPVGTTAVVIDDSHFDKGPLENFALFVEFGLSMMTVEGFQPVQFCAASNGTKFIRCIELHAPDYKAPIFASEIKNEIASLWFKQLLKAHKSSKDHLHITADRFVRYSKAQDSPDALLDLCISLESLVEGNLEISFRFGACLAKVSTSENVEEVAELLFDLYKLRSALVHGSNPTKSHTKLSPNLARLRQVARAILTTYTLYLTNHSQKDWDHHLKSSIFR